MNKVAAGDVLLALSDEFLRELSRVAGYPDVEPQIVSPARALRYGLEIGPRPPRWIDSQTIRESPREESMRDPG